MKKNIFLIMVICLSMLGSCKKFLELQPITQIGEDEALTSKDRILRALNGAYSRLQVNEYYGFEWANAVWLSDDNVIPYSAGTTDLQFDGYAVQAASNTMDINWRAMYQAVNAANNVIDGTLTVSDPNMTTADRDNITGQALFIRALVYFDLVRTWGGVPIITTPTRGLNESSFLSRNTAGEVYAQVLKDLDEAEAKLPLIVNRNIASRRGAQALKSRVYLYQKNWAKAEEFASLLINDAANYSLVKPFENLITEKRNAESIFELDYNGNDGNAMSGVFLPQALGGGYRIGPTSQFMALMADASKAGSRNVLVGVLNGAPYGNRYRRIGAGRNDDNIAVLRLAEMYMIRAEARANQSKLTEGLADVNMIRVRADLPPAGAGTQAALLQLIEDERRIEFAFEPHRWFDLIRTNRAGAVLGVTDAKKYVFPIPANEILVNKQLVQNEGY